jgi:hypothetical protein
MNEEDIKKIVEIRSELVSHFSKLRDYKSNKNALMKESDHARIVHRTITQIDSVLKEYVEFE